MIISLGLAFIIHGEARPQCLYLHNAKPLESDRSAENGHVRLNHVMQFQAQKH